VKRLNVFVGLIMLTTALGLCTTAAPAAAQGVTLRYHWTKGDTLSYRLTTQIDSSVTGTPAGDLQINQTITQTLKIVADDVAQDGTATLRETFEAVKMDMDGPMGHVTYDTAAPAANQSPMAQAAGQVFSAMVGETITIVQAPDGTVNKVDGASRILDKMAKGVPEDMAAAGVLQGLKTMLSDDALKTTLQQSFSKLPPGAVKPGDAWKGQLEIANPMVGKIAGALDFTLKAADGGQDGTARIGVAMALKQEGAPGPGVMGMTMTLGNAKGEGEILFDVGKGRIQKSTMKSVMPATIAGQAPDGTQMSMQNTTTTNVTMELINK